MVYKKVLLSLVCFCCTLHANEEQEKKELPLCLPSFGYVRAGAFAFVENPLGGEAAIGYRFRTEKMGWGPLINVSYCSFAKPALTLKGEILFYPKTWRGWNWGIMPGFGIAKTNTYLLYTDSQRYRWGPWPTLEFVFGKEYRTANGNAQFFYFSISPLAVISFDSVISFDYGFGF